MAAYLSPEPLHRVKDAAKKISDPDGRGFQTIYRILLEKINSGAIPHYEIGKRRYVRLSEVEAFIQNSRKEGN